MWIVLDLPKPLVEAFPLVGLAVLVLALVVGEQVLGPQESSRRGQSGRVGPKRAGAATHLPTHRQVSPGWGHLRFVGAEEEDGVFVGRGLHRTVGNLINLQRGSGDGWGEQAASHLHLAHDTPTEST